MGDGLLGWATESLVRADDQAPGVLARVLTASPRRRQAILAAVAIHGIKGDVYRLGDDPFPPGLADVIRHGRATDILRMTFGDVPHGFPGLLEQIGERPLDWPQGYLALHQMLARNDVRAVDALRGSGRITRRNLEVLSSLDPRWHHAHALSRLDTGAEAIRFNAAVEFVQSVCSRADDEAVATAIANMTSTSTLPRLLDRFARRADRLPLNPVQIGDNELRPFTRMQDYQDASRRYRNCLSNRAGHIAAGRLSIAEFRREALIEFRPMTAGIGWTLWAIYGHRNAPVPACVCAAVEAKCDSLGIPRINENAGDSQWRSYRSFTQHIDWDWA